MVAAIRHLSRPASAEHPVRIALRGRTGSGRRTLLAALAAEADRAIAVIDAARLPRAPGAFAAALGVELRRALILGLVPCVCRLEDVVFEDPGATNRVAAVLRTHPGPLAVRLPPDGRVPFEPGHLTINLPRPDERERLDAWRRALADADLPVRDPAPLASRYRVGPGTIHAVVAGVAANRDETGAAAGADATDELEDRIRQVRERRARGPRPPGRAPGELVEPGPAARCPRQPARADRAGPPPAHGLRGLGLRPDDVDARAA